MATYSHFKKLEAGQSDDEALLRKIQMRKGNSDPVKLETALQKYALNKKIVDMQNEKMSRKLQHELQQSENPQILKKNWYTVKEIEGADVRVTKKHVEDPFNMQPVIVHHPKDRWYGKVREIPLQEAGETYTKYIGENPKQPQGTQGFWVAVTEQEYFELLDRAKNEDAKKKIENLNRMALDGNVMKMIRAPLFNDQGKPTGDFVRLIRGDILKRYREEKKDSMKLSDEEKELNSLKAVNDRMEQLLMKTLKKSLKVVKKAEHLTSGLDAKTQEQLKKLTDAFNHPLKMGFLYKPWEETIDGEKKYFCDMLNDDEKQKEINDKHGTVNDTASAYQQFGDREKATNRHHKALNVNGVCVSPEVKGPRGKPYAQEVMPKMYHHLEDTNALTKKMNKSKQESGLDVNDQSKEERVWGDFVFCARPGDDEEECSKDGLYPLTNTSMDRSGEKGLCVYSRLQRRVSLQRLNKEKMPKKIEKGEKVQATIDLGKEGLSKRFYDATIKRVRGDGTLDLEFEGLSERQRKMMPGRCEPKLIGTEESGEAADLYHDKFFDTEQKYIKKKKKKGRMKKNMTSDDLESILSIFKRIEERVKDEKEEDFDEEDDDRTTKNIRDYHRM